MKFSKICKMSQKEIKKYLTNYLKGKYNNVTEMDGFVYAEGTFPVLLVAHMDTVHKEPVRQIVYAENGNRLSSPQGIGGDDRCGIYMISKIIQEYKCSVLFTEDEEIGCVGASEFVQAVKNGEVIPSTPNYIIEFDRKGKEDAVFYNCDNPEFENFILKEKDWKLAYGSYTDIVEVAPELEVAAVNFSCGYYNPHTLSEYVLLDEMETNIKKVKKLLARTTSDDWFEYIEAKYNYSYGVGHYAWNYDYENYDYMYKTYYIAAETKGFHYIEKEIMASSKEEALGHFVTNHPDVCFNDIVDIFCEDDYYLNRNK